MREIIRPYSVTYRDTTAGHTDIPFVDTAGNPVLCNYVLVQCDGAAGNFFSVAPSGLSGGKSVVDQEDAEDIGAAGTSTATSAVRGVFAPCDGGSAVLSLSPRDAANGIRLAYTGGTNRFFVQYGVVHHSNTLADNIKGSGV